MQPVHDLFMFIMVNKLCIFIIMYFLNFIFGFNIPGNRVFYCTQPKWNKEIIICRLTTFQWYFHTYTQNIWPVIHTIEN